MPRLYAQFAAVAFLVLAAAGIFTGDASKVVHGQASGNIDGVALHLTYAHDVLNLLIAAVCAYAGWRADDRVARDAVLGVGALLLVLSIIGFIVGDDASGSRSIASVHFPLAINIFDLVAGVLAVLCGLGGFAGTAPAVD